MTRRARWIGLGLLLVAAGCGVDEVSDSGLSPIDPGATATPTPATSAASSVRADLFGAAGPTLVRSAQSACKGNPESDGNGTSRLEAVPQPRGPLQVTHFDVQANCAAKIVSQATVTPPSAGAKGSILIVETITNPDVIADCDCLFDVVTVIAGLAPGDYEVSAKSPDGVLTGPVAVSVPLPSSLPSLQSACKKPAGGPGSNGPGVSPSTIQTSLKGHDLTVEHLDVAANCASKLALVVIDLVPASASQPGSIRLDETILNPGVQANCFCTFDVSATVFGLPSGTYQVIASDLEGKLTAPLTVVVP